MAAIVWSLQIWNSMSQSWVHEEIYSGYQDARLTEFPAYIWKVFLAPGE